MFGSCFRGWSVISYLDDLLISSTSLEECSKQLETILGHFKVFGVMVKLKKLEFLKSMVSLLGYIISDMGIAANQDKMKAIQDFKTPRNLKKLQIIRVCTLL